MSRLEAFLAEARKGADRSYAVLWVLRGVAAAGLGVVVLQLVGRRWPTGTDRPLLLATVAAGALLAVVGWSVARPGLVAVARMADLRLGGRERLATAWELAGQGDALVLRQRTDTDAWMGTLNPRPLAMPAVPRRDLGIAIAVVLAAVVLSALPNPSLARHRVEERYQVLRDQAADDVATLANLAEEGRAGENTARRSALVRELRKTEDSLRKAKSTAVGVAALSRAHDAVRALVDPSARDRGDAASAAGAELAQAGPASAAGAALAGVGGTPGQGLQQLAAALPGLGGDDQAAMVSRAAEAAAAGGDQALAEKLLSAAADLAAGRSAEGLSAVADAARDEQQRPASQAAAELSALAQALPGLDPGAQAELAQALEKAAQAAVADPELAAALRRAGDAARAGQFDEAQNALTEAGRNVQRRNADSGLDADAARAGSGLKSAKEALLAGAEEKGSDKKAAGSSHQHSCSMDHHATAPSVAPSTTSSTAPGATTVATAASHDVHGQECAGESSSGGEGSGSQNEGEGSGGEGQKAGGGAGAGPSAGGGEGEGGGDHRGSGSSGARGSLGQSPGLPNERVYAPGVAGAGRSRALPSEAASNGAEGPLVPYERVYAEYRAAALTQADRQVIPDRLRDLLRQYFQDGSP